MHWRKVLVNKEGEDLRTVNPDLPDNPPVGTRLIVYKQIKV